MPHSIFFMKDGHAIHRSLDVKNLGKPVSHGCVRISPKNAATLYALVKKNDLENKGVVVTGVSPGGEYGVARGQTSPPSVFSVYLAPTVDFIAIQTRQKMLAKVRALWQAFPMPSRSQIMDASDDYRQGRGFPLPQ